MITREVRFNDYDVLGDGWDVRVVERPGTPPQFVVFIAGPEPCDELDADQADCLGNILHLAAAEARCNLTPAKLHPAVVLPQRAAS